MPRVDFAAQVARAAASAAASALRHWVDDETLATLYARATVFAFLSDTRASG